MPTNPLVLVPLAIIGAAVCWFIIKRPQRGLLMFAAFAPLNSILVLVPGGASAAGWKEGLLGFTLVAAIIVHGRKGIRLLQAPWVVPLGFFIALGVASALYTLPLSLAPTPIKITYFYSIVVTLIGLLAPFDAKDRDNLITIMMVMALGTGLFGIFQEIVSPDTLVSMGFEWNRDIRTAGSFIRAFSTFGQPFPFALYEMITIIVGGAVAVADPKRLRNKIFLWCLPIFLLAMSTAIVRAAFLGLIFALLFLGLRHRKRILEWMGVMAAAGVVAVIGFSGPLLTTFFSSSSLGQRGAGWQQSVASVLRHPFGIGLGTTGSAAEKIASVTGTASLPYQPDNYYMKVLIELGPLGLWAFVGILAVGFVYCNRVYPKAQNPDDSAFALGVTATIPAIASASVVATYFEIFPLDGYFWLLLVAVMSITIRPGPSSIIPPTVRQETSTV